MATLDREPNAAERSTHIEATVAREMARRQRLLRLYLLLLLVPLGIAGWFVVAGRSDRKVVEEVVDARVAPVEESYRSVAPKLEQVAELDRVLPEVRGAAQAVAAQRDEVAQLKSGQEALTSRIATVSATLASTDPGARGEVKALSERLAGLERSVTRIEASAAPDLSDLRKRLDRQDARLERITAGQNKLSQSLRDLALRSEQQPGSPGASAGDLKALDARLRALESATKELRTDVRGLNSRVGRVAPPG